MCEEELEQQLQALALALDEAEVAPPKEAESSELLAVLAQIHRGCPEAAPFLEPLGFAPQADLREAEGRTTFHEAFGAPKAPMADSQASRSCMSHGQHLVRPLPPPSFGLSIELHIRQEIP